MSETLQANLFFAITAVAVILIAVFVMVILYYAVGIFKNIRDISNKIDRKVTTIENDFDSIRGKIKEGGIKLSSLYGYIVPVLGWFFSKKKRKSKNKDTDTDD